MYFNFALNLNMTLSSADNPFKQFGPRSGPTFCQDLIRVQTVWHFRGYDKLELNQCFIFALNLYMTLSSADNPFKQFGPRSGLSFCLDLIGVQTVWHFRGYDKLELNNCFIFVLNLYMTLPADDICWSVFQTIWTQFSPDILSGHDPGPNCLTL